MSCIVQNYLAAVQELNCISFNNNKLPREAKKRPSFYLHSLVHVSNTFLRGDKKGQRCKPGSESKIFNNNDNNNNNNNNNNYKS